MAALADEVLTVLGCSAVEVDGRLLRGLPGLALFTELDVELEVSGVEMLELLFIDEVSMASSFGCVFIFSGLNLPIM